MSKLVVPAVLAAASLSTCFFPKSDEGKDIPFPNDAQNTSEVSEAQFLKWWNSPEIKTISGDPLIVNVKLYDNDKIFIGVFHSSILLAINDDQNKAAIVSTMIDYPANVLPPISIAEIPEDRGIYGTDFSLTVNIGKTPVTLTYP